MNSALLMGFINLRYVLKMMYSTKRLMDITYVESIYLASSELIRSVNAEIHRKMFLAVETTSDNSDYWNKYLSF